jgi:hypothetical protein
MVARRRLFLYLLHVCVRACGCGVTTEVTYCVKQEPQPHSCICVLLAGGKTRQKAATWVRVRKMESVRLLSPPPWPRRWRGRLYADAVECGSPLVPRRRRASVVVRGIAKDCGAQAGAGRGRGASKRRARGGAGSPAAAPRDRSAQLIGSGGAAEPEAPQRGGAERRDGGQHDERVGAVAAAHKGGRGAAHVVRARHGAGDGAASERLGRRRKPRGGSGGGAH